MGSDYLRMASWTMKRQLHLVLVMYIIMFLIIMYFWQHSSPQDVTQSRQSSLQHTLLSYKAHLSPDKPHERVVASGAGQADLPVQPATFTLKDQLLVRGEIVNRTSAKESASVGVLQRERGADRTLTSRLVSVFDSILDCPQSLPLSFLGMNWTSADLSQDPACPWVTSSLRNEEHNFVTLGEEMAVLKDVDLNPYKFIGIKGGETIESVFNQNEDSEYFTPQKGFFSLPCHSLPRNVRFRIDRRNYRRSNHLNQWFSSLVCRNMTESREGYGRSRNSKPTVTPRTDLRELVLRGYIPGVTLALQRYEYANIYHTLLDWYNSFLTLLILGVDPNSVTFLIMDGHPWGKTDSSWANLFGGRGVLRAGLLPNVTRFEYMVWVANGYHCPLFSTHREQVPFLPQLREYFFWSYGLTPSPGADCRRLRMLLIRRRDYLAHPRNPHGVVERKIENEDEIHDALAAAFPQHKVRAEQLDLLTIGHQVEIMSQTDVVVAMHGAGLGYLFLLPKGGGLVEMYPKYAGKPSLVFKQLCYWCGIHYVQWMNQDSQYEKPHMYTYIPVKTVVDLVTQVTQKMCMSNGI